jgi:diguanylate cyclase (GGDEF)-like protein
MISLTQKLEPDLPGIESDYRQYYLKSDIRQFSILVLLWALTFLGFIYIDYLSYGLTGTFGVLAAIRMSYLLVCGLTVYLLKFHIQRFEDFDHLALSWEICSLVWCAVTGLTQPEGRLAGVVISLVAVFSFYTFIPNRFIVRTLPPLGFSAIGMVILLIAGDTTQPTDVYTTFLAFLLSNILGILFSTRLYTGRRKEFLIRREEEQIRSELQRMASTDPLTGILNRRWLLELASGSFYRYRRYRRPFSILVMDLDGFKNVNDTLGHQKGDQLLIEFAQTVAREKRTADALGRMGGDEFCLVLPETEAGEATALAERILANCKHLTATDGEQSVTVTVSIGISQVRPGDATLDSIFARADKALYASKHSGRDRWQIA